MVQSGGRAGGDQAGGDRAHLWPDSGESGPSLSRLTPPQVAGRVDRETLPWLNFTVRAQDSGVPPRSTAVPVAIQVGVFIPLSS